ncbi:MAG: hypothetical protein IPL61_17180 [Myxococcales bacterium]|nr:hypothetical protein [Myxococcales bacterium]
MQSDDGYRLWVDGTQRLINLGDGNFDVTTGDLVLAVGWHDLVFDTTESSLGARSILTVASGPELVGQPLPAARLRPAEGRAERFESLTAGAVGEPGPALFTFTPSAGATITGVDVGYRLNIDNVVSNVTTTLRNAAANTTLRNNTLTGDTTDRFHPTAFDGGALTSPWGLGFDIASGGGSLDQSWLTVRYADPAGTGPTPTVATFTSSVRDLLAAGGAEVASLDPDHRAGAARARRGRDDRAAHVRHRAGVRRRGLVGRVRVRQRVAGRAGAPLPAVPPAVHHRRRSRARGRARAARLRHALTRSRQAHELDPPVDALG